MKVVEEEEGETKASMSSEATSYEDEAGLELGLSIGGGIRPTSVGRILTAKDFPSVSGSKRNASQVVGWPPIRASRMYSLVNQAKTQRSEDQENNKAVSEKDDNNNNNHPKEASNKTKENKSNLGFVKVNIDGIAIGRKVDLKSHSCYDSLANALEDMFFSPGPRPINEPSKLLDGSSDFVLTYEDKDGDWMLVGDVPWRMFIGSVKRLRIMRTSEATGLAPRFHQRSERQRIKPI